MKKDTFWADTEIWVGKIFFFLENLLDYQSFPLMPRVEYSKKKKNNNINGEE